MKFVFIDPSCILFFQLVKRVETGKNNCKLIKSGTNMDNYYIDGIDDLNPSLTRGAVATP